MNNIPTLRAVFDRLILVRPFENQENEIDDALSIDMYEPHVLIDFNLAWHLPEDHLAIALYRERIRAPANQIPVFTAPQINVSFPEQNPQYIPQPKNISILPLLIAAQNAQVDFRNYDVVGERNSFRKIGDNNTEYVIGVIRHRNTILLRRYDRQTSDRGVAGFRFEEMCRAGDYAPGFDYYHLVEGKIGSLKILLTGEIDAVTAIENRTSIELTCRRKRGNAHNREKWLQLFLSGTQTLKIGYRSDSEPPQLLDLETIDILKIVDQQNQLNTLKHIHQVLLFLQNNVIEGHSYLFCRHNHDQAAGDMGLFLYEVIDQNDIKHLQFIKPWMLKQMAVHSNNT